MFINRYKVILEMFTLFILSLFGGINVVKSSCSIRTENTPGYNVNRNNAGVITSCEYVDNTGNTVKVEVNTTLNNKKSCEKCTCSSNGALHCCGTGVSAGSIFLEPECEIMMTDNCNFIIVTAKNATRRCPTSEINKLSTVSTSTTSTTGYNKEPFPSDQESNDGSNGARGSCCFSIFTIVCVLLTAFQILTKNDLL